MSSLPPTEEVLGYLDTLSNWGRWGDDDRLGTLNLINADVRAEAGRLVRDGDVVSLGHDMDPADPDPYGRGTALQRFMDLNEVEHVFGPGLRWDAVGEYVGMHVHGACTHLDGLAHYSWQGKNYNGFAAADTSTHSGAKSLSVHQATTGFVTRGVLLDIPALLGVRWLEKGQAASREELEAAEERQGVTVRSGDALMVYTGHAERIAAEGPDPQHSQAGIDASCLPFLRERDVAMLGSDAIQDVVPSGYEHGDLRMPVHLVCLVALGLWLTDNMALGELASTCAGKQRWDFMLSLLPWKVVGVTSSPVNPVALF